MRSSFLSRNAMGKQYLFFILILLTFEANLKAEESSREQIKHQAVAILKANDNATDYSRKMYVYDMYGILKEQIKKNFLNGDEFAAVDIYLLLDGLVEDNTQSLQSLLATNDFEILSKDLSEALSYDDAQKLASALKQNKSAFQTEFSLTKKGWPQKCTFRVNGNVLKNGSTHFRAPSEIPIYVASYCENGIFEVKKIQSESFQQSKEIVFENDNHVVMNEETKKKIPNPGRTKGTGYFSKAQENSKSRNTDFLIAVHLQKFFGSLENLNLHNAELPAGMFLSSELQFKNEHFITGIDFTVLNRNHVALRTHFDTSIPDEKTVQAHHALLLRPFIGYEIPFSQNNTVSWTASAFLGVPIIQVLEQTPVTYSGVSTQEHVGPTFFYGDHMLFGIDLTAEQDLGTDIIGYGVGGLIKFGFEF